jgi:SAM-dependent methyltransferase
MPDIGKDDLFTQGDYSFWSSLFRPVSRDLATAAGVSEGDRVLDVAAGDGNTALVAAGLGAEVTAVDLSPAQIARGRRRASNEQRSVRWVRGRGEHLPFLDGAFDLALDTFGDVLEDPTANVALAEMVRVVRSGGVVGFTNWTGEGFDGAWAELERQFLTGSSEGTTRPLLGQETRAREVLASFAIGIVITRHVLPVRWRSAEAFLDAMLKDDPYLHDLRRRLPTERRQRFTSELRGLVHRWNTAQNGSLLIEMPYLQVIAQTR